MLNLAALEARFRALTEDFKVIRWELLYHFLPANASFFHRRDGSKVELSHSDYPKFFKASLPLKQAADYSNGAFLEENGLRNLIFGSGISSGSQISLIPALSEEGIGLATVIAGIKNSGEKSMGAGILSAEKKRLSQITRVLAVSLAIHNDLLAKEARIQYQGEKNKNLPLDFNEWLNKVKKGIDGDEHLIYWMNSDETPLIVPESGKGIDNHLQNHLSQFKKGWKPENNVTVWNHKSIQVHDNIKNKINSANNPYDRPSLVMTFPISEAIAVKIPNAQKNSHLVIEFFRNSIEKEFSQSDYYFALQGYGVLQQGLQNKEIINSLTACLSQSKESDNHPKKHYHTDLYKKNQLELAVAKIPLTSNYSFTKTDMNIGLNTGRNPSYFKTVQMKRLPEYEKQTVLIALDFFLSQTVDSDDYVNKVKLFLSQGLKNDPLENYLFCDIDYPMMIDKTKSEVQTVIGIISQGYHLLHYSFESGTLKKLPENNYKLTIHPEYNDILIALRETDVKIIKKDLLDRLESEMVVFSHAFPEKLIESLSRVFDDQGNQVKEFFLIKKSQPAV